MVQSSGGTGRGGGGGILTAIQTDCKITKAVWKSNPLRFQKRVSKLTSINPLSGEELYTAASAGF